MRNKFVSISFIIEKNVAMLLISEIKLNDSFLLGQFKVWGFGIPYWYGRGSMVDGILLRIRITFLLNFWNMVLELICKLC